MLVFAGLFALATQHVVKGASGRTSGAQKSRASTTATSARFFDEKSSGFAFGADPGISGSANPLGQSSPAPPVAQTSVS
jgi:hypothetical protein